MFVRDDGAPLDFIPGQFIQVHFQYADGTVMPVQELCQLARQRNIPIAPTEKSTGQAALTLSNLQNGRTLSTTFQVVGTVNVPKLKNWKLEIGASANPTEWKTISSGTGNVEK